MSLSPGTCFGPYEIVSPLGAGGMGEVYQARDTKLHRDVAIKVLPPTFAEDPERIARFRREAQLVASLNHPNVAAIYGLEETNGMVALALELVEGEDLAQRLTRGALPVEEAIAIARQTAEGLEAAHERGIVHRDLKPANIKLTTEGAVKILDFGLAKAIEGDPASSNSGLSQSPTMSRQMTEAGMILGTAAYMAPEQARGRPVDKRADVWSFGVVLHEMLTGNRLFGGETVSDTLAAVLRQEVDLATLPAETPVSVRRLLARCLERDPKLRLRDIGEARIALSPGALAASESPSASGSPVAQPPPSPRWRAVLPWALLLVTAAALALQFATRFARPATPPLAAVRLLSSLGGDVHPPFALSNSALSLSPIALSPDGATLAFTAKPLDAAPPPANAEAPQMAGTRLFVRRLDQLDAVAIPGTEGAYCAFFSPDGNWLAFFAGHSLKKVPVSGGAVTTLCEAPNSRGGAWGSDDSIVFAPVVGSHGLKRIPAAGGSPSDFGVLPPGMLTQRWPQVLPGGAGVLYTEHRDITDFDGANLMIAPPRGAPKVIVRGGYYGRFLPSGHLVYVHLGKAFAVPFDLGRMEATGPAVPVLDGFVTDTNTGSAQLGVSPSGTLAYIPGAALGQSNPIQWIPRDGKVSVLRATPAAWENPRFSPDGQKLALEISDGRQRDVFVYEPASDRLAQLTFDQSNERAPVWSPDGTRITFSSDRASPGIGNLYSIRADGTGGLTRLTDGKFDQRPGAWDPMGRILVFEEEDAGGASRVMVLRTTGDSKASAPALFATTAPPDGWTRFARPAPDLSPDGRWIAYHDDGGVFVRALTGPGKWKISASPELMQGGTGLFPRWSRAGQELIFVTGNRLLVVPYSVSGDEFRARAAELWTQTRYQLFGLRGAPYDLHPDGKRVAAVSQVDHADTRTDHAVLVLRYLDELARLVPALKR